MVDEQYKEIATQAIAAEGTASQENIYDLQMQLRFAVDIWALGVCLHAFLFGTLPFFSDNFSELYHLIATKEVILQELPQEVSETAVINIMRNCLQKRPQQRITMRRILTQLEVVEDFNASQKITLTEEDITTAISVRIDFFTIVRLKLFVKRWRRKAQLSRSLNVMSSQSQTISETLSEADHDVFVPEKTPELPRSSNPVARPVHINPGTEEQLHTLEKANACCRCIVS